MKLFITVSALAFLVQIVLIGLVFLTDIGYFLVYILYAVPVLYIELFVKLPDQVLGNSIFGTFLLLCIPAALYSLFLGGIVFLIKRNRKNVGNA